MIIFIPHVKFHGLFYAVRVLLEDTEKWRGKARSVIENRLLCLFSISISASISKDESLSNHPGDDLKALEIALFIGLPLD